MHYQEGGNLKLKLKLNQEGGSPLMAAAQAGHLDVVEALIQAGARFGHKLSCQIFHKLSSEAKFQQPYFSLMPFTFPCPWLRRTQRDFLDVIFLCSDAILCP